MLNVVGNGQSSDLFVSGKDTEKQSLFADPKVDRSEKSKTETFHDRLKNSMNKKVETSQPEKNTSSKDEELERVARIETIRHAA